MHPALAISSSTTSGCRLGTLLHHVAQHNLHDQTAISLLFIFGVKGRIAIPPAESGDQGIDCHKGHR